MLHSLDEANMISLYKGRAMGKSESMLTSMYLKQYQYDVLEFFLSTADTNRQDSFSFFRHANITPRRSYSAIRGRTISNIILDEYTHMKETAPHKKKELVKLIDSHISKGWYKKDGNDNSKPL